MLTYRYTRALYSYEEKVENYCNRKEIKEEENSRLLQFRTFDDKMHISRILHLRRSQICDLFPEHTSGFRENELFWGTSVELSL